MGGLILSKRNYVVAICKACYYVIFVFVSYVLLGPTLIIAASRYGDIYTYVVYFMYFLGTIYMVYDVFREFATVKVNG